MLAYVQIYAWRRKTNTSDAKLDFSYAYAQMRRSEQAFTIVCYKFGCCATSREVDSILSKGLPIEILVEALKERQRSEVEAIECA